MLTRWNRCRPNSAQCLEVAVHVDQIGVALPRGRWRLPVAVGREATLEDPIFQGPGRGEVEQCCCLPQWVPGAAFRLDRLALGREQPQLGRELRQLGGSLSAVVVMGLPRLTAVATGVVPQTVERQLGESVLSELEPAMLVPSRCPQSDQLRVRHLLEKLQSQGASDRTLRFHNRASDSLGANAFCLPGGILLVTDELVRLASDDERLGVLAHEAGRERQRHPLQMAVHLRALSFVSRLFGRGDIPPPAVGG